ncbi:S-phase kinase-associated protein 2 (skp2) [Aphelenchoides avenae]|nr:S-phase kinase-associated protein 2 (skp2) [Aphelenchus avenae]
MHITEKAVKNLRTLKKLKILSLSRCYEVEPVSYVSFDSLDVLNIYGCLTDEGLKLIRDRLHGTTINASPFVNIARPTVNESVTSIWEKRTRDWY